MGTSYESSLLRRLRVAIETAGNFAVDQTGSPSNFKDVPFVEGSWAPKEAQESLYPKTVRQTMDDYEQEVLGRKSASATFGTALAGTGVLQDGSQAAAALPVASGTGVACWQPMMLKTTWGGMQQEAGGLGAQTKVVSGASTTGFTVTAGHGVRFVKGGVAALILGGRMHLREVTSAGTDAVTVAVAFPSAPSNNDVVYGGMTFFPASDPTSTLQLWSEGAHDYDRFWYGGMQGGPSFDLKLGTAAIPGLGWTLSGPLWTKMSNAAMAAATYSNFTLPFDGDYEFYVATLGSTTLTRVPIVDLSTQAPITYQSVTSGAVASAVQSVLRQRRVRKVPFAGSVTGYWDNVFDFYAAQAAPSSTGKLSFYLQVGTSTTGPCWLFSWPTVQVDLPQHKDVSGISGMSYGFKCRNDARLGDGSGGIADAPMRASVVG